MKSLFLLLLILINIGYAQNSEFPKQINSKNKAKNQLRLFDEDNIRETVFRYQFKHNGSGRQKTTKVYFLDIDFKDPSDEFMKRFNAYIPPVRKLSQATGSDIGVVDKKTGEYGLIFRVNNIKWINKNKVEVSGGYYSSGKSASFNTYIVRREPGKWVVLKDLIIGIS